MFDTILEILGTLKRNKMRTALTGFAVSWGIFILIVLLGAGNGLMNGFTKSSEGSSFNMVRVSSGWTSMEYDGLKEGRLILFYERDIQYIKEHYSNFVEEIGGEVSGGSGTTSHGQYYTNTYLQGVSPIAQQLYGVKITKGRFLNTTDIKEHRKVAVISSDMVDVLFPNGEEPLGSFIQFDKLMWQVVGIYKSERSNGSEATYVPFETYLAIYPNALQNRRLRITMSIKNLDTEEANDEFEANIRRDMGRIHRFDKTDMNAMWFYNRFKQYLSMLNGSDILSNAIWVIGILTLLGGIVGVSNIMLITVKERTKEFGIRKALGAKPHQILSLIIFESITITTLFGYIGMFCGIGLTEIAAAVLEQQNAGADHVSFADPTVEISTAIAATITLIVAGTLAGFIPAHKATKVKPIEAMRG
ncbi:MAG: ABC transporter permease [Bacteroidia bacterium]|nr:ABC transporter permease [Bacteroidia bacterium]